MRSPIPVLMLCLTLFTGGAAAETRLAVLDFELLDLTQLPATPEELARTAATAPLLRDTLAEHGGLRVVDIPQTAQTAADHGVGYLFEQPTAAAALGREFGADYITVGRVHKPSHLFVYLKLRLVDVASERIVGDYVVELKGQGERLLAQGVQRLGRHIDTSLQRLTDAS